MRESIQQIDRQADQAGQFLAAGAQGVASPDVAELHDRIDDGARRGEARIQAVGRVLKHHLDALAQPQPDSPTRPTLSPWPTEKLMPSTARNCSSSTGGLRENSFASVAEAPWRGYSFTSFSTRRRGCLVASSP